jgi:hypothetical protein
MDTKRAQKKKPAFYKDTITENEHEKYNVGTKNNEFK